jgi:hypothetical protein
MKTRVLEEVHCVLNAVQYWDKTVFLSGNYGRIKPKEAVALLISGN